MVTGIITGVYTRWCPGYSNSNNLDRILPSALPPERPPEIAGDGYVPVECVVDFCVREDAVRNEFLTLFLHCPAGQVGEFDVSVQEI